MAVIGHMPQNSVQKLEALILRHVCAVSELLGDNGRREGIRPEEDTMPRVVIDDRSFAEAGFELAGAAHQNVGDARHTVAGRELAGHYFLPSGVRGNDADDFIGCRCDVQHEIAHVGVQRGRELVKVPGAEGDRLVEFKYVRVDVSIQQFGIRIDEAHSE